MKYCTHCGKELLPQAVVCPNCGVAVNSQAKNPTVKTTNNESISSPQQKFCTKCGNQLYPQAVVCPKCGCAVGEVKNNTKTQNGPANKILVVFVNIFFALSLFVCVAFSVYSLMTAIRFVSDISAGIPDATKLFGFACLFMGLALAPLLWIIPMMIYFNKSVKSNIEVGIAFKVCAFIFINIIAGVLLLCTSYGDKSKSAKDMKDYAKCLTVNAFFALSILVVLTLTLANLLILGFSITNIPLFLITIIPLASLLWIIPMIVIYNNKVKFNQNISTAFKVCVLLFVSLIAGIILLNDKGYQNNSILENV